MKRSLSMIISLALVGCLALAVSFTGCSNKPDDNKGGEGGTYKSGTYTGSAQGYGGAVNVTITTDDNSITDVTVTGDDETPTIGGAALADLAQQIKDAQSAEIDGVSGATLTSTAAKEAAAAAIAQAKGNGGSAAASAFTAGTYSGSAQGYGGAVDVTITTDGSSITDVTVTGNDETPAIGGAALADLEQQIKDAQSAEIDGVSGATLTSTAAKDAAAAAISQAKGNGGSAAASAFTAGTYTGSAQGYGGAVDVTITTDGSSITDVTVTGDDETPAIGGAALADLAQQIKDAQSAEIDGVSGATLTSTAAKEAAAAAFTQAKG